MNGLAGVRVIVVDDRPLEAVPILEAFASKGIPVAFFSADSPAPAEKLSGVRLAVLDMRLLEAGANLRSEASALAGRLKAILDRENGPYVILAWTGYPENVTEVERYLSADPEIPRPIMSVALNKAECRDRENRYDVDLIRRRIEERLGPASPLLVLINWEGQCFRSATDVVNVLSALARGGQRELDEWRQAWASEVRKLMRELAKEEAGEVSLDAPSYLRAFYAVLNPLHADRMEHNTPVPDGPLAASVQAIIDSTGQSGADAKAHVNSMLHITRETAAGLQPGNIYAFPVPGDAGTITTDRLLNELMRNAAQMPRLVGRAVAVWVEVSPVCDHAQGNVLFARLIAGLLVPAEDIGLIHPSGGFVWHFGPVHLEQFVPSSGAYHLCSSARHVVTLPLDQAQVLIPIARLRAQALAALQAWLAAQSARPGVTQLHIP